jgi:hypothetical protein
LLLVQPSLLLFVVLKPSLLNLLCHCSCLHMIPQPAWMEVRGQKQRLLTCLMWSMLSCQTGPWPTLTHGLVPAAAAPEDDVARGFTGLVLMLLCYKEEEAEKTKKIN